MAYPDYEMIDEMGDYFNPAYNRYERSNIVDALRNFRLNHPIKFNATLNHFVNSEFYTGDEEKGEVIKFVTSIKKS